MQQNLLPSYQARVGANVRFNEKVGGLLKEPDELRGAGSVADAKAQAGGHVASPRCRPQTGFAQQDSDGPIC